MLQCIPSKQKKNHQKDNRTQNFTEHSHSLRFSCKITLYQQGKEILSMNERIGRHEQVKAIHKNEGYKRRENCNYIMNKVNKEVTPYPPFKISE